MPFFPNTSPTGAPLHLAFSAVVWYSIWRTKAVPFRRGKFEAEGAERSLGYFCVRGRIHHVALSLRSFGVCVFRKGAAFHSFFANNKNTTLESVVLSLPHGVPGQNLDVSTSKFPGFDHVALGGADGSRTRVRKENG